MRRADSGDFSFKNKMILKKLGLMKVEDRVVVKLNKSSKETEGPTYRANLSSGPREEGQGERSHPFRHSDKPQQIRLDDNSE